MLPEIETRGYRCTDQGALDHDSNGQDDKWKSRFKLRGACHVVPHGLHFGTESGKKRVHIGPRLCRHLPKPSHAGQYLLRARR
jgi:hypothetical protein